jgi:hypothetical protein
LPHVNKWKYWILTLNKIVATLRPFRTRMQKIPNSQMHCGPASYKVKDPLKTDWKTTNTSCHKLQFTIYTDYALFWGGGRQIEAE